MHILDIARACWKARACSTLQKRPSASFRSILFVASSDLASQAHLPALAALESTLRCLTSGLTRLVFIPQDDRWAERLVPDTSNVFGSSAISTSHNHTTVSA